MFTLREEKKVTLSNLINLLRELTSINPNFSNKNRQQTRDGYQVIFGKITKTMYIPLFIDVVITK